MALISCSECHSELSDKVRSCPRCGAPAGESDSLPQKDQVADVGSDKIAEPQDSDVQPSSIFIRFLKGRVPLSVSFWLVFVPVYVVLVLEAGSVGRWLRSFVSEYDLRYLFPMYAMLALGLVTAIGAAASAWKAGGVWAKSALAIIIMIAGAYLSQIRFLV